MNKQTIIFEANEQTLTFVSGDQNYASNTVDYVEAVFNLGENWDFDVIIAVWQSKTQKIATVLGDGVCIVPTEVLAETGVVKVNLAGSDIVSGEVEERLTTYPEFALLVDATAQTSGTETQPITPSQFEQFVGIVAEDADRAETARDEAEGYAEDASEAKEQAQGYAEDAEDYKDSASESATQAGEYKDEAKGYAEQAEEDAQEIRNMGATATTLPAGSSATANYSDGLLTLGIPRGDTGATGATGNGIASAVLNADYTLTLNFTDGTHYTTPSIRGAQGVQGETGNGIDRIELTDTTGAVKTYTIYFADGSTYDFEVTDGEVTLAELASVLPTDTASGAIASFPDGSDLFDYLSCVVNIEPVQAGSGTPSPDNVRPITGWTGCEVDVSGVNLFYGTPVSGKTQTYNGRLTEDGSSPYSVKLSLSSLPSLPVTVSANLYPVGINNTQVRCTLYDASGSVLATLMNGSISAIGQRSSVTIPSNILTTYPTAKDFILGVRLQDGGRVENIQLEFGSTASDYVPYTPITTYPVSWETEAGTVYGGTVDVVSGVLTVTNGYVDLGALTWSYWSSQNLFYTALPNKKSARTMDCLCSSYPESNPNSWGETPDKSFVENASGVTLYVKDLDYTTVASFKTAVNGVQLVYPLATPTTYQLDPVQVACLLGQNNVWADCGDIEEVKYKADVQLWAEKQLREINTAILALS